MNKIYDLICENCGVSSEERNKLKSYKKGDVLEFGSYPQTIKKETITIINTIQDEKGYFTGSDGEKYVLCKAYPHDKYKFSNGEKIENDKEYYFKVEPIKWKVLEEDNEKLFLFSKLLLDTHIFDNSSNDYSLSNIREWLNNDFYNKAFTDGQKELIESTTLKDISNVTDKVFLLSKDDITNTSYGFSNSEYDKERCKVVTDYAKANFAWEYNDSFYYNKNGCYFLRTPYLSDVYFIRSYGNIHWCRVYYGTCGVAPALVIDKTKI